MPAPSQVTAQDINTELGVSSTAQIEMSNNWVKNVACKSSGAISYGDCRWGINFPGGDMGLGGYNLLGATYGASSKLEISSAHLVFFDGATSAFCTSEINFYANGVMRLNSYSAGSGSFVYHRTWLTSGSAGDYTVQFQRTGGDALTGGTTNTDLVMSTTRTFVLDGTVGPSVGTDFKNTIGNLIIKDGGGTLITRPIELIVAAEVA